MEEKALSHEERETLMEEVSRVTAKIFRYGNEDKMWCEHSAFVRKMQVTMSHEQVKESFSSPSYSKWNDDRVWCSQEWKLRFETFERSGRLDKISWKRIEKFDLVTRKSYSSE